MGVFLAETPLELAEVQPRLLEEGNAQSGRVLNPLDAAKFPSLILEIQEAPPNSAVGQNRHDAGVAIDPDLLPVFDPLSDVARSNHGRDAVFAGDNGTMPQDAAHVGHEPRRVRKERRPRRIGHGADENRAGLHLVELVR